MSKGKVLAQCTHASLGATRSARTELQLQRLKEWESNPARRVVSLKVEQKELLKIEEILASKDINFYTQVDLGLTQVPPNTKTVLAIGPDQDEILQPIIGHLKLY